MAKKKPIYAKARPKRLGKPKSFNKKSKAYINQEKEYQLFKRKLKENLYLKSYFSYKSKSKGKNIH
jgi:hypothetical protein